MLSVKECLDQGRYYYNLISDLNKQMDDVKLSPLKNAQKEDRYTELRSQISINEERIQGLLKELVKFPPFHQKHADKLEEFHRDGSYERSVFIMTKFPEGDGQAEAELQGVIDAVKDSLRECNFIPRIANGTKYHELLWMNVELHMLGCMRGIAIVESKYKQELNPNVMMEWGWMRGMGRSVAYLVEKDFDLERADIKGVLDDKFDWSNPGEAIKRAIKGWLAGKVGESGGRDHPSPTLIDMERHW